MYGSRGTSRAKIAVQCTRHCTALAVRSPHTSTIFYFHHHNQLLCNSAIDVIFPILYCCNHVYCIFVCPHNLRLVNLKCHIVCFGGSVWRTKFRLKNLLGLFSIQPIIRFVFVWLFLRLERFWSENAVTKNWASPFGPFLAKNWYVW